MIKNYRYMIQTKGLLESIISRKVQSLDLSGFNIRSIRKNAFDHCSYLEEIILPNTLENIGYRAFYYCSNLTSIIFNGTMAEWKNITKHSSWNVGFPATEVQCTDGQVSL